MRHRPRDPVAQGLREYSVSSSEKESLSRPSERTSVFFLTHRLIAGAYQVTWVAVEDLV
jgi:hypothetical protein